jgi:hypothetical protein
VSTIVPEHANSNAVESTSPTAGITSSNPDDGGEFTITVSAEYPEVASLTPAYVADNWNWYVAPAVSEPAGKTK